MVARTIARLVPSFPARCRRRPHRFCLLKKAQQCSLFPSRPARWPFPRYSPARSSREQKRPEKKPDSDGRSQYKKRQIPSRGLITHTIQFASFAVRKRGIGGAVKVADRLEREKGQNCKKKKTEAAGCGRQGHSRGDFSLFQRAMRSGHRQLL